MLHENHDENIDIECKDPNISIVMDFFSRIQKIPTEWAKVYHKNMEFWKKVYSRFIHQPKWEKKIYRSKDLDVDIDFPQTPQQQENEKNLVSWIWLHMCNAWKSISKWETTYLVSYTSLIFDKNPTFKNWYRSDWQAYTEIITCTIQKKWILKWMFSKPILTISVQSPLNGKKTYSLDSLEGQALFARWENGLSAWVESMEIEIAKRKLEKEKNKQFLLEQKIKKLKKNESAENESSLIEAEKLLDNI